MARHRHSGTYMSSGEVAQLFEVNPSTARDWARRGWLPAVRLPSGRHRFKRGEVLARYREFMAGEQEATTG